MKATDIGRLMLFILCGITFWSTAVIANTDQRHASNVIMLWPKDAASQDRTGMGTPRPDRGDGHIRLTDVTKPSIRYFPVPDTKKPGPAVILCPGDGEDTPILSQRRWSRLPSGSINTEFLPLS